MRTVSIVGALLAACAIAGCGLKPEAKRLAEERAQTSPQFSKTEPDEHGVVCYWWSDPRGSYHLQCVKVR